MNVFKEPPLEYQEVLKNHTHILRLNRIKKVLKVSFKNLSAHSKFRKSLIKLRGYFLWLSILKDIRLYGTSSHLFDAFDQYREDLTMKFKPRRTPFFTVIDRTVDFGSLINPDSKFYQIWNIILLFLLLYAFVIMPWVMAFIEVQYMDSWFMIETVIDFLCICDIVITLNTPYYDLLGKLITSRKKIFLNYLKGFLIFDIISIFPFYLLENQQVLRSNSLIRIVRITSISKVLRGSKILKLMKYLKNSESIAKMIKFLKLYRGIVRLLILAFCVFIMAHFVACMFYLTAKLDNYSPSTWVVRYGFEDEDIDVKYLRSLYFTITVLTTVGFGDITPNTPSEIILCITWMVLGICFYSTIVSTISSVFSSLDSRRVLISEQLNEVERLGCFYVVEKESLKYIKKQINENMSMERKVNDYQRIKIIKEMPRKIQILIVKSIYKEAIKKIKFFMDKDHNFLIDIVPKLTYVDLPPQTIIYNRNDDPNFVYFILKGRVSYTLGQNNFQFKSIVNGAYFGEIEILREIPRLFRVISEEFCEFLILKASALEGIMVKYPIISNEIWNLSEKRYYKNKECYKQVVELIDEVEIKKNTTLKKLAGTKRKVDKNKTLNHFFGMSQEQAEERILDELTEINENLERIKKKFKIKF